MNIAITEMRVIFLLKKLIQYLILQYLVKISFATTKYIALLNKLWLEYYYPLDIGVAVKHIPISEHKLTRGKKAS